MALDLAVVPVAGLGTRLLPATKSQPKEMLPVGRRPVVQYVVEELRESGIKRILFVTGYGKSSIEDFFDVNQQLTTHLRQTGKEEQLAELAFERSQVQYAYTRQREQLGLGHAVLIGEPFVGKQPFVVALGDSIIGMHAKSHIVERMINEYEKTKADVIVCFEELDNPKDVVNYGIAKPKGTITGDVFELESLVEKPAVDEAPSNLAVAARYVFSPAIFEELQKTERGKGGEIQLTDAMQQVLKKGGKGIGIRLPKDEPRFDIGNFESYFQAFVDFALSDPQFGEGLEIYLREKLSLKSEEE
ncbi:UTP--glucose-1-phosphate uridylyltransferase [Thalassoglobus polymorphus]|uniref:UTP--glucose-1-phosphate uridylyltransferase n=1 Tax=Thalassoglobus polymorphus TaxID=2527994 RepID=A0A517QT85_9PLAN|nr:UTP--glucose-1-phosphate uridylyltransferase [Thalassoglobus polymorphus]QDT34798.1 UTP--glucose-1-phosphate uridylyltransferase [Thalassoglobus polymorphus]